MAEGSHRNVNDAKQTCIMNKTAGQEEKPFVLNPSLTSTHTHMVARPPALQRDGVKAMERRKQLKSRLCLDL